MIGGHAPHNQVMSMHVMMLWLCRTISTLSWTTTETSSSGYEILFSSLAVASIRAICHISSYLSWTQVDLGRSPLLLILLAWP